MILRFSIFGNPYYFTFKFLGLTLALVALFSSLGIWQYHRAQEKRLLLRHSAERQTRLLSDHSRLFLNSEADRFYSVHLKGHFDNQHLVLLDNKTLNGQLGYEVYTPFVLAGTTQAILIDRGWVPAPQSRHNLPHIPPIQGLLSLNGMLNLPPRYFSLGSMTEAAKSPFPLRVQYLNIKELAPLLGRSLSPYVVWLDPQDPHGFKRQWQVVLMGPEKHILYTVQWFAFALSLLVLFGALNVHRAKP